MNQFQIEIMLTIEIKMDWEKKKRRYEKLLS